MKLTKKLFIAIMTMALLVVTFSASTFAWFTLGQESEISNIQVTVKTSTGMEVSRDGKEWKNNIALEDALFTYLEFVDLTSSDGINLTEMDGDPVTWNANANADNKNSFLQFDLYVRLTADNGVADFDKVVLNSVSGKDAIFSDAPATAPAIEKWVADATLTGTYNSKTITLNNKYEFDPLNAVKISFTNKNNTTAAGVIYGYENDKSFGGASKVAGGLAYDYALAKDYIESGYVAEAPTAALPTYVTYGKNANETAADGNRLVKYDDKETKSVVLTSSEFGAFSTLSLTDVTNANDTDYVYAKLTIRIWLEGWDADCINAILEKSTKLSFELKAMKNQ